MNKVTMLATLACACLLTYAIVISPILTSRDIAHKEYEHEMASCLRIRGTDAASCRNIVTSLNKLTP